MVASGLVNVTGASAAAKPKLVVTPSTGLTNKKYVFVSGTGFRPKDSVYITECQATAKGESGCDIDTAFPVTITSKGVLPRTKFQVITGTIGSGKCGTAASNLKKCAVDAGNASGGDSAVFKITFAAPKK
jgi:hypothetical protein